MVIKYFLRNKFPLPIGFNLKNLCAVILIFSSINTLSAQTGPNDDFDNDGITNANDLDDDNDGILDCVERGFTSLASVDDIFKLNGSATEINDKQIRLTESAAYQSGQAWSNGKVDFARSFTIRYDAFLGADDNGADGIATVFHNSSLGVDAVGNSGQGIGAGGIQNGIVLEIDTYDNNALGDIQNDHGQIWVADDQVNGQLTAAADLGNLEDNAWHEVIVNWDFGTKTLSYTVGGINAGTYTFPASNPITSYFGNVSKVYFGYTASTGGSINEQSIRFTDFCSELPLELDTDEDGIPNHFDLDSDNDGCPDAVEGSENVRISQVHSLVLPATDPNFNYRGQIKVRYDGVTAGTPAQIISTSALANGVPQLVNNSGNNFNAVTNSNDIAGVADNTDTTQDVGQGIGTSQIVTQQDPDCSRCFRPAASPGIGGIPSNHGITALGRAGVVPSNWPMKITGAYTVLDAKTKGFVLNRVAFTGTPSIPTGIAAANFIKGMMVYDTSNDCLKIYDGSVWSCYNVQTCDNFNQ